MLDRFLAPESATAIEGEASPLDEAAALARLGGNARLLAETAAFFLEDYPPWLAEMADALRRGNAENLHYTAHTLRGAVSHFGPSAVCRPARELETSARDGDLTAAAHAFAALKTALRRLNPALTALAAGPGRRVIAHPGETL